MSKNGSLSRIALYKKYDNKALLDKELKFYSENYFEKPKEEQKEKVKKNKD
jgi:hypothetical protein